MEQELLPPLITLPPKSMKMAKQDFQIEFPYNGVSYYGLVRPQGPEANSGYRVSLESENQESYLDIILTPSASELEDWDFTCGDGEDATNHYDLELLEEIGEQIEEHFNKDGIETREQV